MRHRGGFLAFALIAVFVIFLALLIFFIARHRPQPGLLGTGVPGLAAAVPADTCLLMGFDLRQSQTDIAQRLEKLLESNKELKKELGLSPRELFDLCEPQACLALFPLSDRKGLIPGESLEKNLKPFEGALIVQLTDERRARTTFEGWLARHKLLATHSERDIFLVGGGPRQWAYHFGREALILTTGRGAMERVLDVAERKQPGLAESASFKDALIRVPVGAKADATIVFWDIQRTFSGWEKDLAGGQATEAQAAAVNGLQYLALGAWSGDSAGFLKLDKASKSKLVRTLLQAGTVPNGSASFAPAKWGSYQSLNLPYLYANILELVRLTPEGPEAVDALPIFMEKEVGFTPEALLEVLDGELGATSNALEIYAGMPEKHAAPPEPTWLVFLGLKDRAAFEKLLDKAAVPSKPVQKIGETPVFKVTEGLEWTLVSKPTPMALLAVGPRPREALSRALETAGKPGDSVAEAPEYVKTRARAGERYVSLDYVDIGGLVGSLAHVLDAKLVEGQKRELGMLAGGLFEGLNLKEASFVTVDPDGLRMGGGGIRSSLIVALGLAFFTASLNETER